VCETLQKKICTTILEHTCVPSVPLVEPVLVGSPVLVQSAPAFVDSTHSSAVPVAAQPLETVVLDRKVMEV
jgi:hypothetical protein